MLRLLRTLLCIATLTATTTTASAREFWLGADISGITDDEANGRQLYNSAGEEADIYDILKEYDIDAARIRVWVNPERGFSSPQDVLQLSERARDAGMPVMIDFHYSDWWADPGKQNIPAEWKDMSIEQMCEALAEHTRSTLQLLRDANVDIKWVQVGNETTHGFLWPMGKFEDNPENYARLTQAGAQAVKEIFPNAAVIIHLDNGFDQELYDRVFDTLKAYGVEWDIIGMSLYPFWAMEGKFRPDEESTLRDAIANIRHLKQKYGTDVMITEVGVDAREPEAGYAFMTKMFDAAINETNGACIGVFYWAPEINADAQYHLGAFAFDRPTKIMDSFRYAATQLHNLK